MAKTNKWVSQHRENILKLTDVSASCICYYSYCQGLLQRPRHCLANMTLVMTILVFTVQVVCFWSEWGRHGGGLGLPLW